jgi:hypothetical protein
MKRLKNTAVLCSGLLLLSGVSVTATVSAADKSTPMLLEKNATANKASPKLLNPQVQGSQWGVQPDGAQGGGQSRRRGDVILEDVQVTKELDKATPKLQEQTMPGKAMPPAMPRFGTPSAVPGGSKSEPKSRGIVTPSSSQGGGAGKADMQDLSPVSPAKKAAPALLQKAAPPRDQPTDLPQRGPTSLGPQPEPPDLPAVQKKGGGFAGPDGNQPPPDDNKPPPDDGSQGSVAPGSTQGFTPQPEPPGKPQPGDKSWDPTDAPGPAKTQ